MALKGLPPKGGADLVHSSNSDGFGLRRVLEPAGAMPQSAWKIDNTMVCGPEELLLDVETLNIDSASFRQIKEEVGESADAIARRMLEIVAERGKHHNPVTGSGGMLIGRVAEVGAALVGKTEAQVGDRVATLVSLSLTPLLLDEIVHVDVKNGQVRVKGQAILFASGIFAKMPTDLEENIALAVFDVCGAPAQTARLVHPGQSVVLFGAGGKSGLTVLAQARRSSPTGRIVAVEYGEEACQRVRELGMADVVLSLDATQPVAAYEAVREALGPAHVEGAHVVINCVNVPKTEMACILCCRDRGVVYFFSMATSFTAAALGAEGVGKDIEMVIGNGYCKGHADHALQLLREEPKLLALFRQKFA